jgi:hypothetical protein
MSGDKRSLSHRAFKHTPGWCGVVDRAQAHEISILAIAQQHRLPNDRAGRAKDQAIQGTGRSVARRRVMN